MWRVVVLLFLVGGACEDGKPGAAHKAFAGKLTAANFAAERVDGPASQGLAGDFFLRNDKLRAVIQAPGRAIGPCPWGGNVIDLDLVAAPAGDQLGEVSPFLGLGRTANFTSVVVERDGSDGGAAVIVASGPDEIDDFINIIGIAGFTVAAISPSLNPSLPLHLDVTATYTLAPGDSFISIQYDLHNQTSDETRVLFGTLTDTGAEIELFHPTVGFGEFAITDFATGGVPTVEYVALRGNGISYGLLPVEHDPATRGAPLPVGGVVVEAYEQRTFSDALTDAGRTVTIGPSGTATRTVQLMVTPGGVSGIETQVRLLQRKPMGTLRGSISGGAGARVAVSLADVAAASSLVTVLEADSTGAFAAQLPLGKYLVEAEGDGYRRAPAVPAHVTGDADDPVALAMPAPALLSYHVTDGAGQPSPAKITVVGAPSSPPDRRFRDTVKDPLPYGIAAWLASVEGDSSKGTLYDHPLPLGPGHYRVVISRGPEWSRFEKELDLGSAGAMIDAQLHRVVDTTGYLACDFHQHSNKSPDSPVPPEARVATNLADGVEYLSSSDYDFLYDYKSVIAGLAAEPLMDSGVGVESTPFDYGHFIAWPLRIDALQPNGGALDWGNAGMGDLTPAQIFDGLRGQGAQVVQVNHPRTPPLSVSYQQNFDRANLRFDFKKRTFFSDTSSLEVSAKDLGLPEDASLFSPNFNAVEVYLGFWPRPDLSASDRERGDILVNTILRDWMNFLSFGFLPTAVGDSDTHQRVSVPAGMPRTMVRVPDDSSAAIRMGVGDEVARTVSGAAPRDVVVTNGPMVQLTVAGATIGHTATPAAGATTLPVRIDVQSADWAPFDTVELFANESFVVPPPAGQQPEPLLPALCFTSRVPASARCAAALGGARPLTLQTVDAGGAARLEAHVDTIVAISDLTGRVRAGATGRDLWLVARVTGRVGLFPVLPVLVDPTVPLGDLTSGKPLIDQGVPALAFTNPVFVDVDGSGWRAPFAP